MAKKKSDGQPTEWHTQHHYPLHPFGRYAGRRRIERLVTQNARNYQPMPLTGCTLSDPLSDVDKEWLVEMGLATIDTFNGQFVVDYAALGERLRTAHGIRAEDLEALRWPRVMEILRPADSTTDAGQQPQAAESRMSGEARALAILTDHPEWTDRRIAREAGLHVKTLYKYSRYKTARGVLKQSGRAGLPHGFRTDDGDIEAYE